MTTCSPLPGRTHELQHLLLQFTQKQLGNIYSFLVEQIAAIISSEESASAVVDGAKSASAPLTTAPGCARDDDGKLRLQFYASAENITREIDGLLASRRRLQSTPCSSTVGTTVSPMHLLQCLLLLFQHTKWAGLGCHILV
jgi:hypothetical protein